MAVNVQGLLAKSTTTHHNNMKHSGKGLGNILLRSVVFQIILKLIYNQ